MIRIPIKLYYKNNGTLFTQGYLNKVPFINKLSNYAYDLFLVTPANDNTIVKVAFEKGDGTTTSEYPMAKVNTEEVKVGTNLETWTIFKYSLEDSILDISNSNHKNKLGIGFTVLEKEIVPKLMPSGETVQEEVFHSLTYEPYNATCNYAIVGSQRTIEDTPFQVIMDYLNEMLNTKLNIKDGITKVAKLPPIVTDNTLPTYNLNYAYILTQEDTPHMLGDIVVAKASGYETLVYGKQYIDSYKLGTQGQIDLILERLDSVESTASSNFTDINQVIKPDIANLKAKDTQLESKINTNTSSITTLDTKVDNNKVELDRKINGLDTRVGANETNIGNLETRVGTNENDIAMAKSDIEQAQADINTNRTNIAKKLDKNYSTLALRNEIADTDLIPILRVGSDTPNKITGADLKRILGNAKDHFKGDYLTEEELNKIVGEAGDFAYVNEVGKAPVLYLWDANDNVWAKTDTSQFVTQAVFDDYKNLNDAEVAKKLDKVSNEEYVVYGTGRKDGSSGQAPQRTIQYNQQPYGNGIVQRMGDGRVKGTTATEDNDLTNLKQVNGLLANAKAIIDVAELPTQDINENVIYRVTKEVASTPVAVPNDTYVGNIYFNTNLSKEEILQEMSKVTFMPPSDNEMYIYISNSEGVKSITCQRRGSDALIRDRAGTIIYTSVDIDEGFVGWNPIFKDAPFEYNDVAVPIFRDFVCGQENDKISNLLSIEPYGSGVAKTFIDYFVHKGNEWNKINIDSAIEDVASLPTENIKDNVIYRVNKEVAPTPIVVPNNTYVNNIYFNTNLNDAEVTKELDKVTFVRPEGEDVYYFISSDTTNILAGKLDGQYLITDSEGVVIYIPIDVGAGFVGWNPEYKNKPYVFNGTALPTQPNNITNGAENSKITNLLSITPYGETKMFSNYFVHKNGEWKQFTTDAYSLADKIEGSTDVAVDVNETGDKLNVHLDTHFKETLATKQILNNYMPKHTFNNDIFSSEFYNLLIATPDVNSGDLFVVHTQTETPQDAIAKGFPALEVGSVVYGYLDLGQLDSPLIVSTSMGSFKITDGSGALTCESLGGGGFEPKAVTINQPASATNGNLSSEQLATLQANDLNYIVFNNEIFFLNDKTHTADTLTYSHVGYENGKHLVKTISITISTKAWVMNISEIGGGSTGGITYEEVE